MLSNWDCYLTSSQRNDVAVCEARVTSDIQRSDLLLGQQQQPFGQQQQVFATANTQFGLQSNLGFNRSPYQQSPACMWVFWWFVAKYCFTSIEQCKTTPSVYAIRWVWRADRTRGGIWCRYKSRNIVHTSFTIFVQKYFGAKNRRCRNRCKKVHRQYNDQCKCIYRTARWRARRLEHSDGWCSYHSWLRLCANDRMCI